MSRTPTARSLRDRAAGGVELVELVDQGTTVTVRKFDEM
jgi:hypothetical protein